MTDTISNEFLDTAFYSITRDIIASPPRLSQCKNCPNHAYLGKTRKLIVMDVEADKTSGSVYHRRM